MNFSSFLFRFARGKEGSCFGNTYKAGRLNEERVDLNRNFPTWQDKGKTIVDLRLKRQKETILVMDWILKYPFVLSANFHDGAILANYPYDDYRSPDKQKSGGVSKTPDHDVFYHLATSYTSNHPYMEDTSSECQHWGFFKDGVTNGADWYEVSGGMQDFNYDFTNAMELTIEVSCCKYPDKSRLVLEWNNNILSLISYVEQAQRGIKGYVTDENNKPVKDAEIQVQKMDEDTTWRTKSVTSDSLGRYWRILTPGLYRVQAVNHSGDLKSQILVVTVQNILRPLRLDLTLKRQ
jgi:carboxypeptidase D